jgi:hypothetical protein
MATRSDRFRDAYAARYRHASALKRITTDIADEQQRYQAERSYLEQMRSELNALDVDLSKVDSADQAALELLRYTDASVREAARVRAIAGAERRAATRTPAYAAQEIDAATGATIGVALDRIARGDAVEANRMTAEAVESVVREAERKGANPKVIADFRAAIGKRERAPTPTGVPGARPLTREQEAELARVGRAVEIVEFGDIAGGSEGYGVIQNRRSTASSVPGVFPTKEDAFRAYVSLLDDGTATVEELAIRFPSADPADLSKAFAEAQSVYAEAKATGGYEKADRKFFSERYLDQARKVAQAQAQVDRIRPQYDDPAMERTRRLLRERGIDPDDPYIQYYGTALYKYAPVADRLIEQVKGELPLEPATKAQHGVMKLLEQYEATDTEWKVSDLEKQLGKTLKGEELDQAIGFALALDRQKREGGKPKTQLELQVEQRRRDDEFKRKQKDFLNREYLMLDRMKAEKDRLAQEAQKQEDIEQAAPEARQVYARARAAGQSPEEARQTAMNALRGFAAARAEERRLAPYGGSEELARIGAERREAAPGAERAARLGISAERGRFQEGAYEESPYLFGEVVSPAPTPATEAAAAPVVTAPAPREVRVRRQPISAPARKAPPVASLAPPAPGPMPSAATLYGPATAGERARVEARRPTRRLDMGETVITADTPITAPPVAPPRVQDPFARLPGESNADYAARLRSL